MRSLLILCLVLISALLLGCTGTHDVTTTTTTTTSSTTTTAISGSLIAPADLAYVGAFRLPAYPADPDNGWEWGGTSLAYYSGGDPSGASDGYPGSLFGTGHNLRQHVGEISLPVPVNSASKTLSDLNTATLLQGFTNVRSGIAALEQLFANSNILRAGMAYLPALGSQTSSKLYVSYGAHYQEDLQDVPSHLWVGTDLSGQQGSWRVLNDLTVTLYSVNDYMFEIPETWASANVSNRRLATGRFRDGGWGGQGPNLFAIAPWADGNPPTAGSTLATTTLLRYASTHGEGYLTGDSYKMNNYHESDEWEGGAWLTAGSKSAVIFVGTKGQGSCWYGFSEGTVYPIDGSPFTGTVPPYPNDDRGWWSSSFEAQMIFYNPSDLAAVAAGTMQPYEPQPYATLSLDQYL